MAADYVREMRAVGEEQGKIALDGGEAWDRSVLADSFASRMAEYKGASRSSARKIS